MKGEGRKKEEKVANSGGRRKLEGAGNEGKEGGRRRERGIKHRVLERSGIKE